MRMIGILETASAKRYLSQFCKHFAHKLPVELAAGNEAGTVGFGAGTCVLEADDARLTLTLNAETADNILVLQDVAIRHLVRFAFREELKLEWRGAA
jgi:hypothetical protein